jgi:hypothetical protein
MTEQHEYADQEIEALRTEGYIYSRGFNSGIRMGNIR